MSYVDLLDVTGLDTEVQRASAKLMFYLSILFSDDVRLKSEIKCPEQVLRQKKKKKKEKKMWRHLSSEQIKEW